MNRIAGLLILSIVFLGCGRPADETKNDSTIQNVSHSGSEKNRIEPKNISLELVCRIGNLEEEDENYNFYMPQDMVCDKDGNLLVADEGNFRIMKYDKNGIFINSYGKQGQGPNEFSAMNAIAIDNEGNFFIADHWKNRIIGLSPEGKEFRRYEAKKLYGPFGVLSNGNFIKPTYNYDGDLLEILNREGKKVKGIGKIKEYRDREMTKYSRYVSIDVDDNDDIYVAYQARKVIEKYNTEGKLLFSFERKLNFDETTEYKTTTYNIGGREYPYPLVNSVSAGIAVDEKGYIWVATYRRQLNESEISMVSTMSVTGRGGGNTQLLEKKLNSNSDLATTDAYILEVFDQQGNLIKQFPLEYFCDKVKIFGNRLFILDVRKGMCVYEYRIEY